MKFALLTLALALTTAPAFAQQDPGLDPNPMTEAGELHNAYLGCLMKQDPEVRLDPFRVLFERCGMHVDGNQEAYIAQLDGLLPPDPLASWDDKLAPYRGEFDAQQQNYIDELKAILSRTDATPQQVGKSLSGLSIRASGALGREQADLAVLGAISIAQHSLQFWTSEDLDASGLRSTGPKRRPWWKVLFVVVGDAAGGLIGGLAGGAVAGPAGALQGGIAIGSAASQAVGNAIAKD
jgi:hypothetical protein